MSSVFRAAIVGGDSIEVNVELENNQIQKAQWSVIGRSELYTAVQNYKEHVKGDCKKIPVPEGKTPEQLLLKELVLKIRGEWGDQPSDPELCHCRKIPQSHVERAIILGAHTIEKVRQRSSANTGCGTCMPEVEELLKKYLG